MKRIVSPRSLAALAFTAAMFIAPAAANAQGTNSGGVNGGGTSVSGGSTKTTCVTTTTYYSTVIVTATAKHGCNGSGGVDNTSASSNPAETVTIAPAP